MIETHLDRIDLNLLLVLHVLLEERSVTRAAGRLGRTQPAVSRALGRLRKLLADPLLVREGGGLRPTARAEALEAPLRQVLVDLEARVLRTTPFDPATSDRTFTLSGADYSEALLLPGLVGAVAGEAPGVGVVALPGDRDLAELVEEVDVAIGPLGGGGAAMRTRPLGAEQFAVLVRKGHPRVGEALDLDTWLELPHVLVAPRNTPGGLVDQALAAIGRRRRVALRLPNFLVAPRVIARTDHVLTVPRTFAEQVARELPLRVLPPPIGMPGFTLLAAWHERWQHDPGHAWLRERLFAVARSVFGQAPGRAG